MEVPQRRRYKVVLDYALRGVYVAVSLIINYLLFYLVPTSLFNSVGQLTPNLETNITSYFFAIEVFNSNSDYVEGASIGSYSISELRTGQSNLHIHYNPRRNINHESQ